MKKLDNNFKIPKELMGEDVYDTLYIFDNKEEAINYISDKYKINIDDFLSELHEEDYMREEYGKENYLRSASVNTSIYLNELMNGQYILWEAY